MPLINPSTYNPFAFRRPQTTPFQINPFGLNTDTNGAIRPPNPAAKWFPQQQQDTNASIEQSSTPQTPTLPDFMSEYNKLSSNRPNRLAYQNLINAGPEEINRGKWAKLGAALVAGGSTLATGDPSAGFNLAMSSYEEPQRQADEDYKRKLAGYANLAGMEDSDVQEKLKALETQHNDYYKQQENTRQNRSAELQELTTAANLKNVASEMDHRDTDEWIDPDTGWKYQRKPGGQPTPIAKVQLTTDERATAEANAALKKETALKPIKDAEAQAITDREVKVAGVRGQNTLNNTTLKDQNSASRLMARLQFEANKPNATEQYKTSVVGLKSALASDPTLANYVKQLPDGTYVPKGEGDFWGALDDYDKQQIAKVQSALLTPVKKQEVPNIPVASPSHKPATPAPGGWGTPIIR